MTKRSLYGWNGGKYYEAEELTSLFPKHGLYVEVFWGSGVLLLNKPKANQEFGNDKFTELINLWEVLTNKQMTKRLEKKMRWYIDSLSEFQRQFNLNVEELNRIKRAYRFLYLVKMSFQGNMRDYHSPIGGRNAKTIKDFQLTWENTTDRLMSYHERVNKVHFYNLDFADCLDKIKPHPDKFLFLDPPYLGKRSYEKIYKGGEFKEERYDEMRDKLEIQTDGGSMWMITCEHKNDHFDKMKNITIKFIDRRGTYNRNPKRPIIKSKVIWNYDLKEVGSCSLMEEEETGEMMQP